MINKAMREISKLILLLLLFSAPVVMGQTVNYSVARAPMSSNRFDEFCPAYYKGGIVFCSSRDMDFVNKYSNQQGNSFIKILYIDTASNSTWKDSRLFSRVLKTKLNDGPVTFSQNGKIIYFSRNILVDGSNDEISSPRNKLGLFYSDFDGEWKTPRSFRYNSEWYNITDPCLSPDSTRLYFVSDKPGGYGGTDIYYCDWKNDFWGDPVNMGPAVNTPENEAYPFECSNGELFFSSDKPGGLGGKDIYFTKCVDSVWLEPVHLNAPINSKYDDFGLVSDPIMDKGYFSSNRDGSYDIFSFKTLMPQFFYCKEQRINQYCFNFTSGIPLEIIPSIMAYEWDFGDSKTVSGEDVEHCFPGPGVYNAEERIVDRQTGHKILVKQQIAFEIKDIEEPFISSEDYATINENIEFNSRKSYTPGKKICAYYWDFDDGSISGGATTQHKYSKAGVYKVKLALTLEDIKTGELTQPYVYKNITITNTQTEKESYLTGNSSERYIPEISEYDHAFITNKVQFASDSINKVVYEVKIFTSKALLTQDYPSFRNIDNRYFIKDVYEPETDSYRYIVSEEPDFLKAYQIYKSVVSLGFKDAEIQPHFVTSQEEQDFYKIRMIYGDCADDFFVKTDSRLSSSGFTYIDQIILFLNRYPDSRLVIELHNDRAGSSNANYQLSTQRGQVIVNYMTSRGIDVKRLICRSYGDIHPLALDNSEKERRKNQRIDFMVIKSQ
jgi:flagellar motor protein MotB